MPELLQYNTVGYGMPFRLRSSADGESPMTGLAASCAPLIRKEGSAVWTTPLGAVDEVGNGEYVILGNATDRNTKGGVSLQVTCTGCKRVEKEFQVVGYDPGADYPAAGGAPTTSQIVAAMDADSTRLAAINADTDNLQTRIPAALIGGLMPVTVSAYPGNTPQTGDSFARLGAPAGASHSADVAAVKADTAAIKQKTDNLPASPMPAGGQVTLGTDAITAAAVSASAASKIAVAARTEMDANSEMLKLILANLNHNAVSRVMDTDGLGRATTQRVRVFDTPNNASLARVNDNHEDGLIFEFMTYTDFDPDSGAMLRFAKIDSEV